MIGLLSMRSDCRIVWDRKHVCLITAREVFQNFSLRINTARVLWLVLLTEEENGSATGMTLNI